MVFKFLEKVRAILTICLLSPAFAVQIYTNHIKMQQYNKDIQFYWCYIFELFLNKKGTQTRKSETHIIESALLLLRSSHGHGTIHFFLKLRYPYNWWIGENETQWEMIICQWHKIAVYAYPGIVNMCFIGKNTFHLCENILNLLWNFASKNKTKMQFDMLRVTFSISNYTLHYLAFAENII